jgi:hypothetical protein
MPGSQGGSSRPFSLVDLRIHDHVIIGNGTHAWVSLTARGARFIVDLLILAKTFPRTRFAPAGPGRGFLERVDR